MAIEKATELWSMAGAVINNVSKLRRVSATAIRLLNCVRHLLSAGDENGRRPLYVYACHTSQGLKPHRWRAVLKRPMSAYQRSFSSRWARAHKVVIYKALGVKEPMWV